VLGVLSEDSPRVLLVVDQQPVGAPGSDGEVTNLSAWAFIRGVCGALFRISMSPAVKTASNAWVYLLSRSRSR
jgi:hypothetical protein